jgi:hypothetical protein
MTEVVKWFVEAVDMILNNTLDIPIYANTGFR